MQLQWVRSLIYFLDILAVTTALERFDLKPPSLYCTENWESKWRIDYITFKPLPDFRSSVIIYSSSWSSAPELSCVIITYIFPPSQNNFTNKTYKYFRLYHIMFQYGQSKIGEVQIGCLLWSESLSIDHLATSLDVQYLSTVQVYEFFFIFPKCIDHSYSSNNCN